MPHQATVTAKTGPDRQVTALVLQNVIGVDFQLNDKRLFIQTETGVGDNIKEFDLTAVTTVTVTITNGNYAVVVS
jgi:hypothetical protein